MKWACNHCNHFYIKIKKKKKKIGGRETIKKGVYIGKNGYKVTNK